MSRPHANSVDADNAWGKPITSTEEQGEDIGLDASDVIEKEKLVKDIISKQDGLRALLQRVSEVQGEATKLKSDNETLQTYIDNLTRNNAMAAR
ncbi:uncharacterized protein JCM6883_006175 [Sporobolomyces salmoneus]|uniref:uncharacterized protein n=1 Tax=Sporobolomyces salmoneus TaxID=183962 RepID=UPI003178E501